MFGERGPGGIRMYDVNDLRPFAFGAVICPFGGRREDIVGRWSKREKGKKKKGEARKRHAGDHGIRNR